MRCSNDREQRSHGRREDLGRHHGLRPLDVRHRLFLFGDAANQGAEVVKIEQPDYGDAVRHSGPPFIKGESPYYWSLSYEKSLELDLKNDDAKEALYELVEEAFDNPQINARGTVTDIEHPELGEVPVIEHPLKFRNADSGFELPPPLLGEHNREVFRDRGYSEAEIDRLAELGVFGDGENVDGSNATTDDGS